MLPDPSSRPPIDALMEGLIADGLADGTFASAAVISNGNPCKCGPGFCASERGLGYYGFCGGSRPNAAPDCPLCTAPHQSDAGCWACSVRGGNNPENAKLDLRLIRLGINGRLVAAEQDRRRWTSTMDEILDEIESGSLVLS